MLRLTSATVGPIETDEGVPGNAQHLEAYNAGDGSLSLSATSSAPWLVPSVQVTRPCTLTTAAQTCIPLQLGLNTAPLAVGAYTGTVTVSDANPATVDAPQTITVTIQVGGSVPSKLDVYVAPNSVSDTSFYANDALLTGRATTSDGNNWLSLALTSTGSFQFSYPYRIRVAPQAGNTAGGVYTGSLVTSDRGSDQNNKTIPVTMRVTTQPIAQASATSVSLTLAQGAPPYTAYVSLANTGQGTLTAQSVSSTGQGFTASLSGNLAVLQFNPGSLAPGDYPGSITIASNGVNGAITVQVDFQVVAKGAPSIPYGAVLDDTTGNNVLAPGDIGAVYGSQFLFDTLQASPPAPLPTQLESTQVLVNGEPAPLYYVSYNHIAFQVPVDAPTGTAVVEVKRGDGSVSNLASVGIASRAPVLLLLGGGYGAIVNQDFSLPMPIGTYGTFQTHPAQVGDALTIYAIGLGQTNPSVGSGAPAPSSPLATLNTTPTVVFGGGIAPVQATPFFAGLTPTAAGLYQVNVVVPPGVPKGAHVNVSLVFPDSASNAASIAIQ